MVVAAHEQCLGHRVELERPAQPHVELTGEQDLGRRVREGRAVRETASHRVRRVRQRLVVDDGGREADLQGTLGVDGVAEQEQLGGAPEADHPRKQVRGAHVGAGEPDLGEEKREARRSRQEAEIRRERDHRAGAGGDAVDRRDHRQRALAERSDNRAGHARELEQIAGLHRLQGTDDLDDVTARAESPAACR